MRSSRARAPRTVVLGLIVLGLIGAQAGVAGAVVTTTLVPIGSDYQPDTLQLFAAQAAARDTNGQVHILVLPITYSLDAFSTTKTERKKNLTLAANRRGQVETACNVVKGAGQTCRVDLEPVLIRADALDVGNFPDFEPDLDGMYVLGGDQTVAMNVVHDTPLEAAMTAAFGNGAAFGGNSAGDAVQSVDMINGYTGSNGPAESMRQGAVELCTPDPGSTCVRGLPFGLTDVITDQHVFEFGRTGRSLNIALQAGKPVLGMDAATGGVVTNKATLRDVTGDTLGYVIDPLTYAATAVWAGPTSTLAARRVAIQLIPPGSNGYDLVLHRPVHGAASVAAPSITGRTYPAFTTPAGAGTLYLAGGIVGNPGGIVGDAFVADAGGSGARIVVLATGYAKSGMAAADAKAIATALAPDVASVRSFVLDARTKASDVIAAVNAATGIVLTAPDRARVLGGFATQPAVMDALSARWTRGAVTVLADNAAAAALGTTFVATAISADVEVSAPLDILGVPYATGRGWVTNLDIEPRLLPDQAWPQLFRLASQTPSTPAAGVDVGTAIRIAGGSATAIGDSAVVVLDASRATFGLGTNGALQADWLLLDSFVNGQAVAP